MRKIFKHRAGFTLVELLISLVISVMVFAAIGSMLVKTMRLWCEGAEQFYLANQARAVRARLLNGGLGCPGSGLLSATSNGVAITQDSSWSTLSYTSAVRSEVVKIKGCVTATDPTNKSILVQGSLSYGNAWQGMVGVNVQGGQPDVSVNNFASSRSNKIITLSYLLSSTAAGKTFVYPQIIQAYMVNSTN